MTLLEALTNQRKYYKTDRNYVFTIDKPSTTKSAVVGGALAGVKGAITGLGTAHLGDWGGDKLAERAKKVAGNKKKALELASDAAKGISKFAARGSGRIIVGGLGAATSIPIGAAIGHAMAKRKLKHADPYVKGILDKVKGQPISRKQYKSLLKGQQAIGVQAHRMFPRSGA
jgi:hypothetical protein